MLCSCTYVFAFALAVYWYNPNGTPIAVCQVPRLYRMEMQKPIFMAGSYIVEFNVPAYPGLYPSFPVFSPILRPKGLRAFHKQLAATTNNTENFTSSFGYFIVYTSLPPSSLYKSSLLELVYFCTAWEPSIASNFMPFLLFPLAQA